MAMATSSVNDDYASSKRSSRLVSSTDSVSMLPEPMSDPEDSFRPDALFIISPNRGTEIDGKTKETGVHESESKREGFIDLNECRNNENEWRQIDLQKDGYLSGHSSSIDSLMSSSSPTHQQVATDITTQDDARQSGFNCNDDLCDEKDTSKFDHNSCKDETEERSPRQKYSNSEQCEGQGVICTDCTSLSCYVRESDYNRDSEAFPLRTKSPDRNLDSPTCPIKHVSLKNVSPRKDILNDHCKYIDEKRSESSFDQKASNFGGESVKNVSPPRKEINVINRGATRKRFIKQERVSISPDFIEPITDRTSPQNLRSPAITEPCCHMIDSFKSSPKCVALKKQQLSSLSGHLEQSQEHCRVDIYANTGKLQIEKNLRQARQRLREDPSRVVTSTSKGPGNIAYPRKQCTSPSRKGNGALSSRESSNQDVRASSGGLSPAQGRGRERRGSLWKCEDCGKPHSTYDRYSYLHKYTEYLNCDVGTYEENNGHGSRGNRTFDSRLETPVASLLYRSRSLPRLSVHDSGVGSANEQTQGPGQPHNSKQLVADLKQLLTLKQHYYPEGGWGWVIVFVGVLVQILSHGTQGAAGILLQQVAAKFDSQVQLEAGWLGAMSTGVALLVSPVTIAFCRRKSTRVTAVMGGLVTALGCLFTSFASQFHQLFFSYGTVVGIGVGMTRDCSTLMVAQYFKRRRELVEIFIVSGSGLGIAVMSAFIKGAISKIGWRLGLQAVTGVVFLTFILGTFYRSASLYHPQRRAILHLKNQKRKIKDKNKTDDRPPFFDFSTLRSKTVRILLVSTGISAFGINTPIFYLAHQAEEEGLGDTVILLQAYMGLAWTLGCVAFGLLVVHRNVECRIARQYLTQAAVFVCGLCILALTAVQGNYHGYVMFAWIYGIFCGGYHYSLKMYTYERVRARNFARTWGFVQCSQAIPIAIGVPISGYMNVGCGGKAGYYFSSTCVLVGSFTLFFIDLHKRNVLRHKHTRANGTKHLCVSDNCPQRRRLSFSQEPDNDGAHVAPAGTTTAALVLGADIPPPPGEIIDGLGAEKPELTCISEEGIADMDLPDNLLEDLDYIGDCITSCNKVENYLMLSEFENNLIAEMPIIMDRRGRRWSLAKSKTGAVATCGQQSSGNGNGGNAPTTADEDEAKSKHQRTNAPSNNRSITVIDEAST